MAYWGRKCKKKQDMFVKRYAPSVSYQRPLQLWTTFLVSQYNIVAKL